MTDSKKASDSSVIGAMRKVYRPIGFKKCHNFVLWFIFAGALMGFTLARLQYIDFYGVFCSAGDSGSNHAAPGECLYYLRGHEKVGIILHLATILPASFLVIFQFVPAIRYKVLLFHRLNGYLVIILSLLGTVGALMIARHAFGGTLATQYGTGFISIAFVGALAMAIINIKRLQIEQHRAWMLRAWFYVSFTKSRSCKPWNTPSKVLCQVLNTFVCSLKKKSRYLRTKIDRLAVLLQFG